MNKDFLEFTDEQRERIDQESTEITNRIVDYLKLNYSINKEGFSVIEILHILVKVNSCVSYHVLFNDKQHKLSEDFLRVLIGTLESFIEKIKKLDAKNKGLN